MITPEDSADLQEFGRELGSGGFVFVFEENIGMIPSLRTNTLFPSQQIGPAVISTAQPQITPTRSVDQLTAFAFVCIGDTQSAVARSQQHKDFLVQPGWMPELKRHMSISGQK
jgi:hypothetical protein